MAPDVKTLACVGFSAVVLAVLVRERRRKQSISQGHPVTAVSVVTDVQRATDKVSRITLKSSVFVCEVEDLSDQKAELWWQQSDYAEFLRVRVELGKAYRDVAKRRGVPVDSAFPAEPSLAHESRRGLGLGRKRQREKNRRQYIEAVLQEQKRQRDTLIESIATHSDYEGGGKNVVIASLMDTAKISKEAERSSYCDRLDSIRQAELDYGLFLEDEASVSGPRIRRKNSSVLLCNEGIKRTRECSAETQESTKRSPQLATVCPDVSTLRSDATKPDADIIRRRPSKDPKAALPVQLASEGPLLDFGTDGASPKRQGTPPTSESAIFARLVSPSGPNGTKSKGFGQSLELLAQAGLSATGHRVSRVTAPLSPNSKPKPKPVIEDSDDSDWSGISDTSGGESECESAKESGDGESTDAEYSSYTKQTSPASVESIDSGS